MTTMLAQLTATPLLRPCDEPWEAMAGSDRVRHCESCARDVFFVSAMSELEAELRLLNASDATPCIRYARRADGSVVHAPPPRALPSRPSSRSLLAASALGVTLTAATVHAGDPSKAPSATDPKAPSQCVAYAQPAAAPPAPAAAPSPPSSGAAAARPSAPPAPSPSPPPAAPRDPIPLGGAPPPIREQPAYGTLVLKSKITRQVTLIGIALVAPLSSYKLTPGDFVLDVREPDGKLRLVRARIVKDKSTTIDLDKR